MARKDPPEKAGKSDPPSIKGFFPVDEKIARGRRAKRRGNASKAKGSMEVPEVRKRSKDTRRQTQKGRESVATPEVTLLGVKSAAAEVKRLGLKRKDIPVATVVDGVHPSPSDLPSKPPGKRINWSKDPRMEKAVLEWDNNRPVQPMTNKPISMSAFSKAKGDSQFYLCRLCMCR
jgi:hypothetical protein